MMRNRVPLSLQELVKSVEFMGEGVVSDNIGLYEKGAFIGKFFTAYNTKLPLEFALSGDRLKVKVPTREQFEAFFAMDKPQGDEKSLEYPMHYARISLLKALARNFKTEVPLADYIELFTKLLFEQLKVPKSGYVTFSKFVVAYCDILRICDARIYTKSWTLAHKAQLKPIYWYRTSTNWTQHYHIMHKFLDINTCMTNSMDVLARRVGHYVGAHESNTRTVEVYDFDGCEMIFTPNTECYELMPEFHLFLASFHSPEELEALDDGADYPFIGRIVGMYDDEKEKYIYARRYGHEALAYAIPQCLEYSNDKITPRSAIACYESLEAGYFITPYIDGFTPYKPTLWVDMNTQYLDRQGRPYRLAYKAPNPTGEADLSPYELRTSMDGMLLGFYDRNLQYDVLTGEDLNNNRNTEARVIYAIWSKEHKGYTQHYHKPFLTMDTQQLRRFVSGYVRQFLAKVGADYDKRNR